MFETTFALFALPLTLLTLVAGCAAGEDDAVAGDEGNLTLGGESSSAADCELESVKGALLQTIAAWNIDGAAVGTSFKATSVKLKPGSDGRQGTFLNTVKLKVFEAGRGTTLETSVDVPMQKLNDKCAPQEKPSLDGLASRGVGSDGNAAPCPLQSAAAALTDAVARWNHDGAAVGTTYKVTKVAVKDGSEGRQGTFVSTVSYEVFEAGRGSTLKTSAEIPMQNIATKCSPVNN